MKARLLLASIVLALPACYQQMANHAGFKPLTKNAFYKDERASRPVIDGTVAKGQLRTDKALFEGKDESGAFVAEYPVTLSEATLQRGKERYNIFCSVCHGLSGDGDGRIVQRGFTKPPNYHTDKSRSYSIKLGDPKLAPALTEVPVGYLYDVITRGYGAMADHASQIPVDDRWAIVAYVRALQYARSPELRTKAEQPKKGEKK